MNHLIKAAFRSKANYWAARLVEGVAAPFVPRPRWLAAGDGVRANAGAGWRRGILLGADHLGDILYRTGSLPLLARAAPGCAWIWACPAPAAALLRHNPHVAATVALPAGVAATARALRAGRFDVALCYDTGSYQRFLLAACLAGIPDRVGYVHKGMSFLATHAVPCSYPSPFPHYFRDLAALTAGEAPRGDGRPLVHPSAEDEAEAVAFLRARGLERHPRLLACSLFTRQPHGTYPLALFAEALRAVRRGRHADLHVVLVGSAGERERLLEFAAEEGIDATVQAGELGLLALVCLLRRCRAAFTSDSGIRHLSNAAGIPVVFPHNPWFDPVEAGPYCGTETDVAPPGPGDRAASPSFNPASAALALAAAMDLQAAEGPIR